jgi:hypothetical protein
LIRSVSYEGVADTKIEAESNQDSPILSLSLLSLLKLAIC